jgi:predicted nucleic acid-binding protein
MIVSDSSTLILLAKASVLEALACSREIAISRLVYEESALRGKELGRQDALLIARLVEEGKITVLEAPVARKEMLSKAFGICGGENETVALALEHGSDLVLTDDRKNMTVCRVLGIKYLIALDAVIGLHSEGSIDGKKLDDAFRKVVESGWLKDEIIADRLKRIKRR